MRRNLAEIADGQFDLVVVGGGIHGICVARDAALRGMSVALLERGDFGAETSHNSLKIIHGGFRYIQHLDFPRMRQSVLERRAWLRIAPHLVRPMKVAMQTNGHTTRGPEALWIAGRIYELIGIGRNKGLLDDRKIPRGKVVGRGQSDILFSGLETTDSNGAAYWYDGQMQDADRIMIECLDSAVSAGAVVANYVQVSGLSGDQDRVSGVVAEDLLTGNQIEVSARVTVNTAGPWADSLRMHDRETGKSVVPEQPQNLNMNIVVNRHLVDCAIGVKSEQQSDSRVDKDGRLFFITPWKGISLIGTTHESYDGHPDDCILDEARIASFIDEVNEAHPRANISRDDVIYCHWGLTPREEGLRGDEAKRARHGRIIDHERDDKLSGLISVSGVKWTTARLVAEKVVDNASKYVGRDAGKCSTSRDSLPGGVGFESYESIENDIRQSIPEISSSEEEVSDLATEYGTRWCDVMDCEVADVSDVSDTVFRRKAVFAVRNEMAVRLSDVLCRRTNLLQRGKLRQRQVDWCLTMMAEELDWSSARIKHELGAFEAQRNRNHGTVLQ